MLTVRNQLPDIMSRSRGLETKVRPTGKQRGTATCASQIPHPLPFFFFFSFSSSNCGREINPPASLSAGRQAAARDNADGILACRFFLLLSKNSPPLCHSIKMARPCGKAALTEARLGLLARDIF